MSCHRFPNLVEILQGDLVGNIRKGIASKDFRNCEYNCNSMIEVKCTCDYVGECRSCCVFHEVMFRQFLSIYLVNTQNTLKKITEQQFQYVAQKLHNDKHELISRKQCDLVYFFVADYFLNIAGPIKKIPVLKQELKFSNPKV